MKKTNKSKQAQNMNVVIRKVSSNGYEIIYFNIDNDKVVRYDGESSLPIWIKDFESRGHIVSIIK